MDLPLASWKDKGKTLNYQKVSWKAKIARIMLCNAKSRSKGVLHVAFMLKSLYQVVVIM